MSFMQWNDFSLIENVEAAPAWTAIATPPRSVAVHTPAVFAVSLPIRPRTPEPSWVGRDGILPAYTIDRSEVKCRWRRIFSTFIAYPLLNAAVPSEHARNCESGVR